MPLVGEFESLAEGLYLEGLAIDQVRGVVWYSDVIAGGVHGVRPDGTAVASFNADRMWTGGVLINEDGAVLSSGEGGIMWNHPETDCSGWLLREIDGQPINGINEMIPDGHGGIYFGTVDIERIKQGQPARPSAILRLTAEGALTPVFGPIGFANGLMRSEDGRELYCCETFDGPYAFAVDPDGRLSNRRRLIDKEDCDGMALDAEGNLWVTGFRSGMLTRLRRDGATLEPVPTPAGAITQLRFGGADMRDVYITAVPVDGGDGLKEGVLPTERRSTLYRGRGKTPGLPIAPTRFRLTA